MRERVRAQAAAGGGRASSPPRCTGSPDGEPIVVFGDGFNVRDYVFVADIADAMIELALLDGGPPVVNVGTGDGVSLLDLVALIRRVTGRDAVVEHRPDRGFDVRENVLDNSRLRALREPVVHVARGWPRGHLGGPLIPWLARWLPTNQTRRRAPREGLRQLATREAMRTLVRSPRWFFKNLRQGPEFLLDRRHAASPEDFAEHIEPEARRGGRRAGRRRRRLLAGARLPVDPAGGSG